jgi:hypothetical protein
MREVVGRRTTNLHYPGGGTGGPGRRREETPCRLEEVGQELEKPREASLFVLDGGQYGGARVRAMRGLRVEIERRG